jgi:hypothetical protein
MDARIKSGMTDALCGAIATRAPHRPQIHFQTAALFACLQTHLQTSPRNAPEPLKNLPPQRGRGECRMPAAPAVSCAITVVERTRVTTSTPASPGIPARNGFTTYFALSPVTGLFCHRRPRTNVVSAPGRADTTSANLTPASGRQDHTTSPYATTSLVRTLWTAHELITRPAIPSRAKRCRVHRIPAQRS